MVLWASAHMAPEGFAWVGWLLCFAWVHFSALGRYWATLFRAVCTNWFF